jgi:hypothetical protein
MLNKIRDYTSRIKDTGDNLVSKAREFGDDMVSYARDKTLSLVERADKIIPRDIGKVSYRIEDHTGMRRLELENYPGDLPLYDALAEFYENDSDSSILWEDRKLLGATVRKPVAVHKKDNIVALKAKSVKFGRLGRTYSLRSDFMIPEGEHNNYDLLRHGIHTNSREWIFGGLDKIVK